MWPIREIRIRDSGEGKSHKRALRGRTQMRTGRSLARADRDRDHEAVRFERRAPAQRLVEDPRAGYDPGLEFANRAFESLRLSVPGVTSPT